MLARTIEDSERVQTLKQHCENVSLMMKNALTGVNLSSTGELIGWIHDMGKSSEKWQKYLLANSRTEIVPHSFVGASFIYENFSDIKDDFNNKNEINNQYIFASQLIALVIDGHHGGLKDIINPSGDVPFENKILEYSEESISEFFNQCISKEKIARLFKQANFELNELKSKIANLIHIINSKTVNSEYILLAHLTRYINSVLIDCDRLDAFNFENEIDININNNKTDWEKLQVLLKNRLDKFKDKSEINLIRQKVSDLCFVNAIKKDKLFRLTVPTGGGKTLASLRFALQNAKNFDKDKIFYIIPYTTIIDQTAREFNNIFSGEDMVLEHHSNLVIENEDDEALHNRQTERYNKPIVITTLVQFLNSLYGAKTSSARRMNAFANSVIIFDEVQSIPINCLNLFNMGVLFLTEILNCTVVLCSATQPLLDKIEYPISKTTPLDIISKSDSIIFEKLKRTKIIDTRKLGELSADELAEFALNKLLENNSALIILNTKSAVLSTYNSLKNKADNKIKIVHLSTSMCANHRMKIIDLLFKKTKSEKIICVSTQLIEAGIDISFDCVIRSLAGIDSIIQSTGRCNRNGEYNCKNVYVIKCKEEKLSSLKDIQTASEKSERIFNENRNNGDIMTKENIDMYYKYYFFSQQNKMNYPLGVLEGNIGLNITDLLGRNLKITCDYTEKHKTSWKRCLQSQSFATAYKKFSVIKNETIGIAIPYEYGKELIEKLNSSINKIEKYKLLSKLQQYTVNIYENVFAGLQKDGMIYFNEELNIYFLKDGWYDNEIGLTFSKNISPDEYIF